jgi:hypothetical protein
MIFAGSVVLVVIGLILRFATHLHVGGVDLRTAGLILIVAGVVGLVVATAQWAVWSRSSRHSAVVGSRRDSDC